MLDLFDRMERLPTPTILVLGDIMLDRYTWGDAERVSPEAPVLILRSDLEEVRLGGAASVAFLLRALGASVQLAGIVGDDAAGRTLTKLLTDEQIDHSFVLTDATRPTTVKERFVGRAANRHPNQILRVDRESRSPLSGDLERAFIDNVRQAIPHCQAVLISDYGKGVCTPVLLAEVIATARSNGVPVLVDPARGADPIRYRHATLLKPNRLEAEAALGRRIDSPAAALEAGQLLCQRLQLSAAVITLDRDGLVVVPAGETGEFVPTHAREVYDITGAGDMALAVLGICQAASLSFRESALLANLAAGVEIERLGVAAVTRSELRSAAAMRPGSDPPKRVTLDEIATLAEAYRRQGKSIVFTNGCFDLLHVGHLRCLEEAAQLGDILIVGINSDNSVRRLKGESRPVINEQDRATLLAALACVDHVVVFDDDTPHECLRRIRPDWLVKGGTYGPHEVVGQELVESYGGRAHVTSRVGDMSTTRILQTISR
jgi:D-beta-D-heptose 7-phosphate kinase/D-beta-D-heptose 1-phosphate adenosyltransferase